MRIRVLSTVVAAFALALAGLTLPASAAGISVGGSIGASTITTRVTVSAYSSATGALAGSFSRSDANGRYALTLPGPGTYTFVVSASGSFNSTEYGSLSGGAAFTVPNVAVAGSTSSLGLGLPETGLAVHLRDPDGNPVEGSTQMSCSQQSNPSQGVTSRNLLNPWGSWRTDPVARGFVIDPSTSGRCSLSVMPRYGVRLPAQDVVLTGDADEITVTVPATSAVQGHLSSPFAGGTATSTVTARADSRTVRSTTADASGAYTLPLGAGAYSVTASATSPDSTEYYTLGRAVTVPTAADVDLAPSTRPVTVHLVDGSGAAVPGGRVELSCQGVAETVGGLQGSWTLRADGPEAHLAVPTEGTWTCVPASVFVDADGYPSYSQADQHFTIDADHHEITLLARSRAAFAGAPADHADELLEASGPNGGDANYDGVPDWTQDDVATLPRGGAASAGSDPSDWISLAAPEGTTLTSVSTLSPGSMSTPPPTGVSLPAGLVGYTLSGVAPGSDVTVAVFVGDVTGINGYAKYDVATHAWSTLPSDRVSVVPSYGKVLVTLTDGGIGDADGTVDGTIVDPGGPAVVSAPPADTTPPTVTGKATTDPNANGWYRGDVTVHWTVSDDGPGTVGAPADTVVTGEGADLTATSAKVCDDAGNCTTGTVSGIKIDRTAPRVSGTTTTQPNAAGWYTGAVTVHWTADDGAAASSGVTDQPADTTRTSDGDGVGVTSEKVCDRAGNCATGKVDGLRIDATKPTLAVIGVSETTYVLGAAPTPTCTAGDATSGLAAACTVSTTSSGPGNGVGTFTVRAAVTDRAGNTASTSTTYKVVYRFDGFAQPVNDPALTPGSPTSTFRTGDTVPVQFTLRNEAGQAVYPRSVPQWTTPVRGAATKAPVNESVSNGGGSTGSAYRLLAPGTWGYDWSTKGVAGGYLYTVSVALDDGTTHTVVLGLR